jgi:hypothetical protein
VETDAFRRFYRGYCIKTRPLSQDVQHIHMVIPVTRTSLVLAVALAFTCITVFAIAFAYQPSPSYYADARGNVVSVSGYAIPLVKGGSSVGLNVQYDFEYSGKRNVSSRILCEGAPSVSAWSGNGAGVSEVEELSRYFEKSPILLVHVRKDAPDLSCLFLSHSELRAAILRVQ